MRKILFGLLITTVLSSCLATSSSKKTEKKVDSDVTEVIYFHTKKRCITCNAIERLAKEVVDSIGSDRIVMKIVDITENEALADKYEVTWSSLILDKGGRVNNVTKDGFSYAKNQPDVFKSKLTEAINKMAK